MFISVSSFSTEKYVRILAGQCISLLQHSRRYFGVEKLELPPDKPFASCKKTGLLDAVGLHIALHCLLQKNIIGPHSTKSGEHSVFYFYVKTNMYVIFPNWIG